jgi:hypothetical protein
LLSISILLKYKSRYEGPTGLLKLPGRKTTLKEDKGVSALADYACQTVELNTTYWNATFDRKFEAKYLKSCPVFSRNEKTRFFKISKT